jgi:hypothetical protein
MLCVLAGLFAAREFFGAPKPLVLTLGVTWSGCFAISCALRRGRECSTFRNIAELLLPWTILSFALLGSVCHFDRGGWLWYQVSGYNEANPEDLAADTEISATEFVQRNPFFQLDPADGQRIVLPRGEYTFSQTILVPKNVSLSIEPGTTVRMGAGCSLISYSPILAQGTPDQPIVFTANYRPFKWGVIGVVGASQVLFEHVRLEHARQAVVNGIEFPGGLSLINADAVVRDCQFFNMFGKDAVYVRAGHASIRDNRVEWAFKDGIDLDGAAGEIVHNLLIDCEDEGIDLSDNQAVEVRLNTIRDHRGGRIAANVNLDRIRLTNTLEFSARD